MYDTGEYLGNHPDWHISDSPWKAEQILKMIRRNGLSPSTIADVGCGAGAILSQLAERMPGPQFVGYEVSPQAHEMSQSRAGERIRFELADLLETEDHYDLVLCIDVVEHIESHLEFLRRLHPRGERFIFHVPLELTVTALLRPQSLVSVRSDPGHVQVFTREVALATFRDAGFRILDETLTQPALENPRLNKRLRTRVVNLPRRIVGAVDRSLASRLFGGYSLLVLAE